MKKFFILIFGMIIGFALLGVFSACDYNGEGYQISWSTAGNIDVTATIVTGDSISNGDKVQTGRNVRFEWSFSHANHDLTDSHRVEITGSGTNPIIRYGIGGWTLTGINEAVNLKFTLLPNSISHTQASTMMTQMRENNEDFIILDVRTAEEFYEKRIEGAVLIPHHRNTDNPDLVFLTRVSTELADYKDAPIFIYCYRGLRSVLAALVLIDLGFSRVYDFGGIFRPAIWGYDYVYGCPLDEQCQCILCDVCGEVVTDCECEEVGQARVFINIGQGLVGFQVWFYIDSGLPQLLTAQGTHSFWAEIGQNIRIRWRYTAAHPAAIMLTSFRAPITQGTVAGIRQWQLDLVIAEQDVGRNILALFNLCED